MKLKVIDNHRARFSPLPCGWISSRMRFAVKQYQVKKNQMQDPTVLSLTKSGVKTKKDLNFGKSTENYIGHQLVDKGQFVFASRDFDATPILCGVASNSGCISNLYIVFDISKTVNSKFLEYYFWGLKHGYQYFAKLSFGMRFSFNKTQFEYIPFIHPNFERQCAIVNFLNRKINLINQLIEKKQRLLDLLEEKERCENSIIFEKIYSENPIWRLKYLLVEKLKYGTNESANSDNPNDFRYIRITDINNDGTLRNDIFKSLPYEKIKDYILRDNDILFARSGTVGKSLLYKNNMGNCCYAGYLIRARTKRKIIMPDFINQFTVTEQYWQYIYKNSIQSTIPNVNAERYANLSLSLPSLQMQRVVSEEFKNRRKCYQAAIHKINTSIDRLKEYSSALITNAVTGQIDVAARHYSNSGDSQLDSTQIETKI